MTREYTHVLNKEIRSISGWYQLFKEERILHMGKDILYLVGDGIVESSCCGSGGCRYAVVPGFIVTWKSGVNEEGQSTSELEPIRGEKLQNELRKIILEKEVVTQVQFW